MCAGFIPIVASAPTICPWVVPALEDAGGDQDGGLVVLVGAGDCLERPELVEESGV